MQWLTITVELNAHQVRILELERSRFISMAADLCPAPSFEDFATARLEVTRKGIHSEDMGAMAMAFGHFLCDDYQLVPADEPDRRTNLALQLAAAFLQSIFCYEAPKTCVSALENA